MKINNQKGFTALEIILLVVVLAAGGFIGYRAYQAKGQKTTAPVAQQPQATKKEEPQKTAPAKKTFTPKDLSVSVQHDDSWAGADHYLTKTVSGRSYKISFQKNNEEYLAKGGAFARDLKLYKEVTANGKLHYVATAADEYGYLSSCSIKPDEACSPKLPSGGYLFISLNQSTAGSHYPVELDFKRADDKQVLAEFADILSTLKY